MDVVADITEQYTTYVLHGRDRPTSHDVGYCAQAAIFTIIFGPAYYPPVS